MATEQETQSKETRSISSSSKVEVGSVTGGQVIGSLFKVVLWEKNPFRYVIKKGRIVLILISVILAAAFLNSDTFVELYALHPILTESMIACITLVAGFGFIKMYAARIGSDRVVLYRKLLLAIVIGIWGLRISFLLWCNFVSLCPGAQWRPIHVSSLVAPTYAAQQVSTDLSIENVIVDPTRSSFLFNKDYSSEPFSQKGDSHLELEFDHRMLTVFSMASCRGIGGEEPIEDALPIWRAILKKRGETALAVKLIDYAGYRDLIQKGREDTFYKALPNVSELAVLRMENEKQYEYIMSWLVNCYGIPEPVLLWKLRNNSNRTLSLSAVDYEVLDIGQVMGRGPELSDIIDVDKHDLYYKKGLQKRDLRKPITIPPKSEAVIRIHYRLESPASGLTWLVRAIFRCSDGTKAVSKKIEIISAKGPKR